MHKNRNGALSQFSEISNSVGQQKQREPRLGLPAIGTTGRQARGFAHDAVACRAQATDRKLYLHVSPLFAGISPEAERELCDSAIERFFPDRNIIFREDDPIRFVDIVTRGSVKITQLSPDGGEVILRIDRAGHPIDGMGDISEKVHITSASAVHHCTLLSWDASVFSNFTEKFPVIQRNAVAIMVKRLRMLAQSFCDLSTARVPQRLARVLLRLMRDGNPQTQEPLGLSREELAQMVGTSLFTTSRLLREWAELGIVYVNRDGFIIEDLNALVRLSLDGINGEPVPVFQFEKIVGGV